MPRDLADQSQEIVNEIRKNPGDWLYHYTTLETAVVHILPTRCLRLSPFSRMRDPREYKRWRPATGVYGEVPHEDFSRRSLLWQAKLERLQDQFKLLSFTMDAANEDGEYGRGFARSRLWESYAEQGRGVCLVLRRGPATDSIAAQLKKRGRSNSQEVEYANIPLANVIFGHMDVATDEEIDARAEVLAERSMTELFFTKNTEWASECEYRFVVRSLNEFEWVDVRHSLVAILRGPESEQATEHVLKYFANDHDLGIGLVQWINNSPRLVGLSRGSSCKTP